MRILLFTPLLALGYGCKSATPTPTDTPAPPDTDIPTEMGDCDAYEFRGETYVCSQVDRCDSSPENLDDRLACCDCDPQLCVADPTCPPDVGPDAPPPLPPPPTPPTVEHSSCMSCHNGADNDDPVYTGPGLNNPHPFGAAAYIDCTTCHGGNGAGQGKSGSHVPAPPQFRDPNDYGVNKDLLANDQEAYFNYLTRTGIDKWDDYSDPRDPAAPLISPVEWLQFMNPGDIRVVQELKGCGSAGCHDDQQARTVPLSPLSTEVGFYSATNYTMGADNKHGYTEWANTAGDYAFRTVVDPGLSTIDPSQIGRVPMLEEYPSYAEYNNPGGQNIFQNQGIRFDTLPNDIYNGDFNGTHANQVVTGSNLEHVVQEVIAQACGDCHLSSAGANNRYADFRSGGCSDCHMQKSLDGRSRSADQHVDKIEPADPDQIAAPERPHPDSHQIRNVAKLLPNGGFIRGVNDYACVGCHQGSNRTVLQFWGIRMDQNKDVVNGFQYPANPFDFEDTEEDTRLYDPVVQNATFNGRDFEQHLLFEDYDNDGRDDTPEDAHYEAGMGCIDCHGAADVHTGTATWDPGLVSHQSQATGITCESCHGTIEAPPATVSCVDYQGNTAECAKDRFNNPLRNVTKVGNDFRLRGRVYGDNLWVPLTQDVVNSATNRQNPNGGFYYNAIASYAMGRIDGSFANGVGPIQTDPQWGGEGFAHEDSLDCNACHTSWTNSCVGCHLTGIYDATPANYFFSNTTGKRIVMNFAAEFTYQSPVLSYLTVGTKGKITTGQPGMKMFYKYQDFNGDLSQVFAFTDRNGNGNNPNENGRGAFGALSHNKIAQHSIRGQQDQNNEGPNTCMTCHNVQGGGNDALTGLDGDYNQDGVTNLEDWETWRAAYDNQDFENLDYALLAEVIGLNTQNQFGHPIYVAMNAGIGSGLFLFDADGCPVNNIDNNENRVYCVDADGNNISPTQKFNDFASFDNVVYDLDNTVNYITGSENASYSQPILENIGDVYQLRSQSLIPELSGNLGRSLVELLSEPNLGMVLDSWTDANRQADGDAALYIVNP